MDKKGRTISDIWQFVQISPYDFKTPYYHYTTLESFLKMANPVGVKGERGKRLFKLFDITKTNDVAEAGTCGEGRVFCMSLTHLAKENVAMWTNYGIPKSDALRLGFKRKTIQEIIASIERGDIFVQYEGETDKERIPTSYPRRVYFVRIDYLDNDSLVPEENSWALKRNEIIKINRIKSHYVGKRFQKDGGHLWLATPPTFKKSGWTYEKEVRIVIEFPEEGRLPTKAQVFVDLEPFFDSLSKDSSMDYIVSSPWATTEELAHKIGSIVQIELHPSAYQGELNMRSVCDICKGVLPGVDTNSCRCPYRENR